MILFEQLFGINLNIITLSSPPINKKLQNYN